MKLHIGEKIRERAKELRMGPTELGKLINTSKQNVYGIFKRPNINAELLKRISEVLKTDFFTHYHDQLDIEDADPYYFTKKEIVKMARQFEEFKRENAELKKEVSMLKEKVGLLKKIADLQGKQGE